MDPAAPLVYLVDDDDDVRESLALVIDVAGWAVQSFASAEAFLDAYSRDRPGCLVLDVRMPGMSGLELQEILAAEETAIPIIFITGHGDIPMAVKSVRAGAVDFLEKPFSRQVLLKRIEDALAQDRKRRSVRSQQAALNQRLVTLTEREREVITELVADAGQCTSKEIGKRLGISHRTVDHHRARILQKMGAKSVPELIEMAIACGFHQPRM